MDTFREKEVMRQTEEVQKVVQQLEQLGHNLEATKQEAMVGRELIKEGTEGGNSLPPSYRPSTTRKRCWSGR